MQIPKIFKTPNLPSPPLHSQKIVKESSCYYIHSHTYPINLQKERTCKHKQQEIQRVEKKRKEREQENTLPQKKLKDYKVHSINIKDSKEKGKHAWWLALTNVFYLFISCEWTEPLPSYTPNVLFLLSPFYT